MDREGRGYQRDPYKRMGWVNDRFPALDEAKLRPIEVAKRSNGMYAAIDGGEPVGWMAQMAGRETLMVTGVRWRGWIPQAGSRPVR